MPFGQSPGPSASPRQVRELLELIQRAGHADFRDARGPMRLTQRQAAGKFTRDEATELIERLQETGTRGENPPKDAPERPSAQEQLLRRLPAGVLAAELQRRGWLVVEP